jgi:hypothetical protein
MEFIIAFVLTVTHPNGNIHGEVGHSPSRYGSFITCVRDMSRATDEYLQQRGVGGSKDDILTISVTCKKADR